MLSKIALLLSLMVSSVTLANPHGTIIIPVEDLLFEATDFKDSPRFDLNAALRGAWTPNSRPALASAVRSDGRLRGSYSTSLGITTPTLVRSACGEAT